MPPPLAPPLLPSFHTTSLEIVLPELCKVVPPQPSTYSLEAGKSTWASPSVISSREPSSPEATQTVMPMAAADWKAWERPKEAGEVSEPGWQPFPRAGVPAEVAASGARGAEAGFGVGTAAFASPTTGWVYVGDGESAQCRVLFVENEEQLDKVLLVREQCRTLQRIVIIDIDNASLDVLQG